MRTVRFREYGEPAAVLRLEQAPLPTPGAGRVRVAVEACGLTPADWALCRGLFAGTLPRGIGIDVAGTVDAVGSGVGGMAVGDPVFGTADWAHEASAGAAEHAVMDHWFRVPRGLGLHEAAAIPMALETAYRSLAQLDLRAGRLLLIHGAGSTVGFAAVQIALLGGTRVIATAGETHAGRLRELGADVTGYGPGMLERVRAIAAGPVDRALDTSPVGGALLDLIELAGGDPGSVLTVSDFAAAAELGTRNGLGADQTLRFDVFDEFAQLAAEGRFMVPIARTFPLQEWRSALELSTSRQPGGKLLLLPGG